MTKVIKTKTTKTFDLSIEQENQAWPRPKICKKLDNTEEEIIRNYLPFIYQLSNVH